VAADNESNQRVSLALLKQGQEHIVNLLQEYHENMQETMKRIRILETEIAVNKAHWYDHESVHRRERSIYGTLTIIGSAIATAVGLNWPKP